MNYEQYFEEIYRYHKALPNPGKVASYIPELSKVNPDSFGVFLTTVGGEEYSYGNWETGFSIQSIVKVFGFVLAFSYIKDNIWERMDMEPAGTSFNSLVQLEYEKGIPRNPFINAGAIVICDILIDLLDNPQEDFLKFIRRLSPDSSVYYDLEVAHSEKSVAFQNYALVNLMKSFGNIHNDIDKVMDLYFMMCSVKMNCKQLSSSFLFLANNGVVPFSQERILDPSSTKRVNALMQTCGFYDEAGEFAFRVGLPGKSGVGGGIAAVFPGVYSIAVWSPKLNDKGNSYLGMRFLEEFTSKTKLSIF